MTSSSHELYQMLKPMIDQMQNGDNVSTQDLLQTSMQLFMEAERKRHLSQNESDKGNGYFSRQLGTPMGSLNLDVPRDRDGDFRPSILPKPHQRDVAERYDILESLLVNGYSPNSIAESLRHLNLHYHPQELDELKTQLHEEYDQWINRELPSDTMALFIDGYHAYAKRPKQVRRITVYVILGVDFSGKKELYGLYQDDGRETKGFWLQVFNQLIERGLKRPLYLVSDNFPGLKEAVATLFPQAFHQLCWVHLQRNVRRNMAQADAQAFNQELNKLKKERDIHQAKQGFQQLCERYRDPYPTFVKRLEPEGIHYLAFLRLPRNVQPYLYTTNSVESVNSMLETIRQRLGGFFQSERALQVNVYCQFKQLREGKWAKGVPHIKAARYELRQLFARQYGELPAESCDG